MDTDILRKLESPINRVLGQSLQRRIRPRPVASLEWALLNRDGRYEPKWPHPNRSPGLNCAVWPLGNAE